MKTPFLFTLTLVLVLGLFSCGAKETKNESGSEAQEEIAEDTTPQGSIEIDPTCANYEVEFDYEGLHYVIINHNSVYLENHESHQSISGDLVIPSTVTYQGVKYYVVAIGDYAFEGCVGLTSVTIPEGVTHIGGSAFSSCSSLTSIIIPNSVTKIGSFAFSGCIDLPNLTIPSSVTSIGDYAFIGMSLYEDHSHWENGCLYIDDCLIAVDKDAMIGDYAIKEHTRLIADYAFKGCEELTSVTIPEGVTHIGDYAFDACASLTSVTIPNSVMIIGMGAFNECIGLTSVTIPNSVTTIGKYAFDYCLKLTTILVSNYTQIGEYAFPEHTEVIRY